MLGIVGSFKPQFYKRIVSQPLARSFGFLVVFVVIISAVVSFQLTLFVKSLLPQATTWIQDNFEEIVADLPDIEIQDGQLVAPTVPYMRQWDIKDEGVFAVVIDPTASDYYSILEGHENVIALTRRKLVVQSAKSELEREIKTYDLDNITSFKVSRIESGLELTFGEKVFSLTPASIKRFLERISLYVFPAGLIFFSLAYLSVKSLQILFFSILSSVFNSQLKAKLNYSQLLNIGTYALVPGTVLAIAQEATGIFIPLYGLFYCIIYGVYLYLGVKTSRQEPVTVTGM